MRYVFLVLALLGILVSAMTIREHYHEGVSPCDINGKWDCGAVNHSPFAVISGILGLGDGQPVEGEAAPGKLTILLSKIPLGEAGIAGYLLIGVLGFMRRYRLLLIPVLFSLGFSIYLTHYVEERMLGVYCIYCVISYGIIVLLSLLNLGTVAAKIGVPGFLRNHKLMMMPLVLALGVSIYLMHYVEVRVLGIQSLGVVDVIYVVISHAAIAFLILLDAGAATAQLIRARR